MYKPKIFLVGESKDELITLEETGYMTEDVLQGLLVDYPDLLPGDQINPENPRRWLLVAREMGVPGDVSETGRWSLDHLFLDQDGTPTFVECKRSADTRIRREVVAQMLDYAANGIEYWSMDRLRQAAAETAQSRGESLDDEIAKLLSEEEADIDEFWGNVESNLRKHQVRLVFVADSTPRELRRLVEFLNEEMEHVEVLIVEVKQFQREGGKSQKALVPRVIGLTEAGRKSKSHTTPSEFFNKCDPGARQFFQRVLDLAAKRGHVVYWGKVGFSNRANLPGGGLASFAYGYPPHEFLFCFSENLIPPGEKSRALRKKLLDFGVFKESGKYRLRVILTEESLSIMDEVKDFIFDEIDKLLKAQQEV